MTQASIAIQHIAILSFIQDLKGASRVFIPELSTKRVPNTSSHCLFWIEHAGWWYLWQQQQGFDIETRTL
ncbi:hypothetical protein O0I10_011861, partial [Lichtheimia ornata]